MSEEEIGSEIVDSAMDVHTLLGPGLLESIYERCLEYELVRRKLAVRKQVPMPVHYRDVVFESGCRIDLLVEDRVLIELKAVEKIVPVHKAQLLSYLRLGNYRLGYLLNFHTVYMRDGIRRVLNGMQGRYQSTTS
jgi:GxxExxY protein